MVGYVKVHEECTQGTLEDVCKVSPGFRIVYIMRFCVLMLRAELSEDGAEQVFLIDIIKLLRPCRTAEASTTL